MKRIMSLALVTAVALLATLGISALATADAVSSKKSLKAELEGFEEIPAVSSTGSGEFRATISQDESSIEYKLTYEDLEGTATLFAHIHLGQRGVNGGVSAFLCGGPKPACPATLGTVTGTITASDVIGPGGQGIAAGEFSEVLDAIREGVTYVNVHTDKHPGGEIRGQIKAH